MSKVKDAGSRLKHLTTLIFDMDNTLINTRRGDLKTCNKVRIALPQPTTGSALPFLHRAM